MNQTSKARPLSAREVYQLLKDLAMGERLLRSVQAQDGLLTAWIDDWTLTLGYDGASVERCEACTAADGRRATLSDWPRFGTDPLSFLSVWERTQLERLLLAKAVPTFSTPRLLLTPLQASDAAAIQQLFAHWEVVRYLDSRVPWPYPEDGALRYVQEHALPAMQQGREWHWMIRLAATPDQCIGSISLYDQPGNHRGFWLAPQWQGHGYIGEACTVINHYWFVTLGHALMQVPKAVGNSASRRVSEREGMRLVSTVEGDFVSGRLGKETWELRREDWLQRP